MNVRELKDLLDQFPDDMPIEVMDELTSKELTIQNVEHGTHRDPCDGDFDYSVVKITIRSED